MMLYLSLPRSLELEVVAGDPVGVTITVAGDCCNNGDRAPAKAVDMACIVAGFTIRVGHGDVYRHVLDGCGRSRCVLHVQLLYTYGTGEHHACARAYRSGHGN